LLFLFSGVKGGTGTVVFVRASFKVI
jgi:hypothetical protein